MTRQNGRLITLAVGNGGAPEIFLSLGGLTLSRLSVGRQVIAAPYLGDAGWQTLRDACGSRQIRITGDGEFTDSAGEERVRSLAFSGSSAHWRMDFGSGGSIAVPCIVALYERHADLRDTLAYRLSLESTGEATYTDA